MIGQLFGELGSERALGNLEQMLAVRLARHLDTLEDLEGLGLRQIEALDEDARVHALVYVGHGLLEHLGDDQDGRGGAVSRHVVLGGGRARDQRGGRVLDLHLV